jgi:hypothetical protein
MDIPEQLQPTEDYLPVVTDSLLPYDHVAAYRYLISVGLKNIRPPKLVDDTFLD